MPDYSGQPCRNNCGRTSIKSQRLCRECESAYKRAWEAKKRVRMGIPVRRKKQRLILGDVVMPVIYKGRYSKNIGGREMAGTDYTRGYVCVKTANKTEVKTTDGKIFDRNNFEFRLIYRKGA